MAALERPMPAHSVQDLADMPEAPVHPLPVRARQHEPAAAQEPPASAPEAVPSAPPAYADVVQESNHAIAQQWAPPPELVQAAPAPAPRVVENVYPAVPPVAAVAPPQAEAPPVVAHVLAPPPGAPVMGAAVARPAAPAEEAQEAGGQEGEGAEEEEGSDFARALVAAGELAESLSDMLWGRPVTRRRPSVNHPRERNRRTLEMWQVIRLDRPGADGAQYRATVSLPGIGPRPVHTLNLGDFRTELQARRACEVLTPPRWVPDEAEEAATCACCDAEFAVLVRKHHCRNCGKVTCGPCSRTRWPVSMLPPLYCRLGSKKRARICTFCHGAMEGFRQALLEGQADVARTFFDAGNINLGCPYSIYRGAMYPVHCAAQGGGLDILAWLVDDRRCTLWTPVGGRSNSTELKPLETSDGRSVLAVAAEFGHRHIVRYLVQTKGSNAAEIKSTTVLQQFLQSYVAHDVRRSRAGVPAAAGDPPAAGGEEPAGGVEGLPPAGLLCSPNLDDRHNAAARAAMSSAGGGNTCIVCFVSEVDSVLVPCGHVGICMECGSQLRECPICRKPITQLVKTFRVN